MDPKTLAPKELERRLDSFPRFELAEYPTPLERLPGLGTELGRPVLVKRDDEIGPALGGNKTRKLEYLMAQALKVGARRVVTFGGLQSNHARITAAAARLCDLTPHLFYFDRRPERPAGNLRINLVTGARMHFIPFGGEGEPRSIDRTNQMVRWIARLRVGPHYFIPVGGHTSLGCLGYVRAALELHRQARDLELGAPWLAVAVGTGGTLAGLLAGLSILGSPIRLLGIDVGKLWRAFPASIAAMASDIARRLGVPRSYGVADVPLIEERYVGPSYGTPSDAGVAAIQRAARSDGLILDPIYTSKAFAGMLDQAERGYLGLEDPLIFLHTGGYPGLFAFEGGLVD